MQERIEKTRRGAGGRRLLAGLVIAAALLAGCGSSKSSDSGKSGGPAAAGQSTQPASATSTTTSTTPSTTPSSSADGSTSASNGSSGQVDQERIARCLQLANDSSQGTSSEIRVENQSNENNPIVKEATVDGGGFTRVTMGELQYDPGVASPPGMGLYFLRDAARAQHWYRYLRAHNTKLATHSPEDSVGVSGNLLVLFETGGADIHGHHATSFENDDAMACLPKDVFHG